MGISKFKTDPTYSLSDSPEDLILGYPTLVANYSTSGLDGIERDPILPGKFGAIWKYSETVYFIMVTSPRIAKKYLPPMKHIIQGEETGIRVPESEAKLWIKRLGITKSEEAQIKNLAKIYHTNPENLKNK